MDQQQNYKFFSTKLSTTILNVSDSLEKLFNMGATSRTRITSGIYKFRL